MQLVERLPSLQREHAGGAWRLALLCDGARRQHLLDEFGGQVIQDCARLPWWPASAAEKARVVAARAAALHADIHALRDVFAASLARTVALADDAKLACPAARLRAQAEAFNGAVHAAARGAQALLARALRHLVYVVVAAHLHVALERSMSGAAKLGECAD